MSYISSAQTSSRHTALPRCTHIRLLTFSRCPSPFCSHLSAPLHLLCRLLLSRRRLLSCVGRAVLSIVVARCLLCRVDNERQSFFQQESNNHTSRVDIRLATQHTHSHCRDCTLVCDVQRGARRRAKVLRSGRPMHTTFLTQLNTCAQCGLSELLFSPSLVHLSPYSAF